MVVEQFYLGCLAHASYLVGSDGMAVVIDPQRDVQIYLDAARKNGLSIAWIIETHLHADFVSGHVELAERTGATICLGEGSGATFTHQPVGDGHSIEFGSLRLVFRATPGHTPESVSIVLTDSDHGPAPYAVFTGDTLFIGLLCASVACVLVILIDGWFLRPQRDPGATSVEEPWLPKILSTARWWYRR